MFALNFYSTVFVEQLRQGRISSPPPADRVHPLAHRGHVDLARVRDGVREQVPQRLEVVGGGRERDVRAVGHGPVPDRLESAFDEELTGRGHQGRAPALTLGRGRGCHLGHAASTSRPA